MKATFTQYLLIAVCIFVLGPFSLSAQEHDSTHDHKTHSKHNGSDHIEHGEHDEAELELTEAQKNEIGLQVEKADPGSLHSEITLPGEIVLNQDTVIHLVPRTSGIVIKANKTIGDRVRKGELLAILDSAELGEAKSEYFERFNEVGCCLIDLQRTRIVTENTRKLLSDLKGFPTLDELRKKDYGDMGEYRSRLLSSYAEYSISKKTYQRKKNLFEDKIASENDFLKTQNAFEKAQAEFYAEQDNARFEIMQQLYERERTQRVNEFKLKTAERKLQILGLTKQEINALQITKAPTKTQCTDPNCKDCKDHEGSEGDHDHHEDTFSRIAVVSPGSGTIIGKHITRGERVSNETDVYTIADLDMVWVNLKVPARDISVVHQGMSVIVESPDGIKAEGKISLVAPVVDEETRTAIVRLVLENHQGIWKPGSFVNGHIRISAKNLPLVVPRIAIQSLEGKEVVFVPDDHGFKPVSVVTGRSDRKNVEIISGLAPGMRYVTKGAFELKAMMITSSLGSHAGHGH